MYTRMGSPVHPLLTSNRVDLHSTAMLLYTTDTTEEWDNSVRVVVGNSFFSTLNSVIHRIICNLVLHFAPYVLTVVTIILLIQMLFFPSSFHHCRPYSLIPLVKEQEYLTPLKNCKPTYRLVYLFQGSLT